MRKQRIGKLVILFITIAGLLFTICGVEERFAQSCSEEGVVMTAI